MISRLIVLSIGLFYASSASAMFCPTNFNQISLGNSFQQVAAQCGPPSSQKNLKEEDLTIPQEWTYFATLPPDPQQNFGSVKITVTFVEGKAINISSGGYSVSFTTLCKGNPIQVGSTIEQVKTACGKPVMVKKGEGDPGVPKNQGAEDVEWIYNTHPHVILKFRNGKLVARQE